MQGSVWDEYIPFIATQYSVRSIDGTKYAMTCDGRVIAQFENYEEAANRAY